MANESEEFFNLHREYLQRPDAVKVFRYDEGGWGVFIQIDGPFESRALANGSAKLITADLADIYSEDDSAGTA